MNDIGHAPFSHVLEHTLINGISHEEISLLMMESINREMKGELNLALKIFKNEYPKKFLHQLISSQLDMDRLDYLRRDSFFTGVTEGNIGSARIIKMLDVADDNLVVNSKGNSVKRESTCQHPAQGKKSDTRRQRNIRHTLPEILPDK